MISYKFNEEDVFKELKEYVDSTYDKHYSQNKIQSTEFIFDAGHGTGFCLGNVIKYAQRWGKKAGANRQDLLKLVHYGIILLGMTDEKSKEEGLREADGCKHPKSSGIAGSEYFV